MIRPNPDDRSPDAVVLRTLDGRPHDPDLLRILTDMLTDDRERQGQDRDADAETHDDAALRAEYDAGYQNGKELSDAERDRIYDEGYEAGRADAALKNEGEDA